MQRYRYQHGDRPLDGYTIQRAAGRGGFGEVYYALSDSGREVAIKAVQNYEQIEIRGISQCMNLKSPHLVTIFDVKYNDRNEPFVIMEYVSGPSLRDLLKESPNGLGAQKAAFFLREIAKGLSFLHECGLVHRDLKPSNIFYENGYVKVGDYGLAKAISASRHSGHTITVGTVHYMAPEIGGGSYNCAIDIYALGVLLYEMLTGDVPFIGSSPAEILMKHMTVTPELDNIEEPFARVIGKALAKDPAERYQTIQEMVEDLFGSQNIRNSVSVFSPDELSVVAQRVAAKANIFEEPCEDKAKADEAVRPGGDVGRQFTETAQRLAQQADAVGQKVAERVDAEAGKLLGSRVHIPGGTDPIAAHQRLKLAFLAMAFIAVGAGILYGPQNGGFITTTITVLAMIAVCSKTILFSLQRWFLNLESKSQWLPKIAMCCLAAMLASIAAALIGIISYRAGITGEFAESGFERRGFPFGFPMQAPFSASAGKASLWFSLAIPMLLVDWKRISSPERSKRLSLGSAVWIGLLGAISAAIFGQDAIMIASVLAGTSLVIQAYSTFGSPAQSAEAAGKTMHKTKETPPGDRKIVSRPVPSSVRIGWLFGFLATLGLGIFLVIWGAMGQNDDQMAAGIAGGVDCLIVSVFCFIGFCRCKFNGWYRYIIKPAILLVCLLTVVASSICMGCLKVDDALFLLLLMMIILPAVAFFVIAVIPASIFVGSVSKPAEPLAGPSKQPTIASPKAPVEVSPFKRLWALLLSAGGLFSICGLHRFYVGKIGTGIIWFLTGGLMGIGQIIDVIMIIIGQFKDRYGKTLVVWENEGELVMQQAVNRPASQQPPAPARDLAAAADQTAETEQAPAVEDSPMPSSSCAPTRSVMQERFHPLAFLFSGIGFILTFAAIVAGITVGLHIPHFIAAGWPNPEVAAQAEQFFGYSGWPELVMRFGTIIVVLLLLLAAVFNIIGRRHYGARHMIRGMLGLIAFFFVFLVFSDAMSGHYFQDVVNLLNAQQIGPAFDKLLSSTHSREALFAGVLFLMSIIVLAWPARNKQMVLTRVPNQGVN